MQGLLDIISKETERSEHDDHGMFALVVMSHAAGIDSIFGIDEKPVRLTDIYHLLSSSKFPGMAGKPKMVVIQAGGRG